MKQVASEQDVKVNSSRAPTAAALLLLKTHTSPESVCSAWRTRGEQRSFNAYDVNMTDCSLESRRPDRRSSEEDHVMLMRITRAPMEHHAL